MTPPDLSTEKTQRVLFFRLYPFFLWVGVILHILFFLLMALSLRGDAENSIILRYNAFLGVSLLGVWWQSFFVPGVSFLFFLTDIFLAFLLARREWIAPAFVFLLGSGAISLLALLAIGSVIFINS